MIDPNTVAQRLEALRRRIESVQSPYDGPVDIMAVTKGFGPDAVHAAAAVGLTIVGENYAQDLLTKRDALVDHQLEVAFIGRLQSNKVRQVADVVTCWASLDRVSVIDEVAKRAPGANVFIQVNATGESNKGGCAPDDVADLVEHANSAGLHVDGLLTVGPTDQAPEEARVPFRAVRSLVDELGLEVCSMGMSADIEVAVACGSTQVRVGSALFGQRPRRR